MQAFRKFAPPAAVTVIAGNREATIVALTPVPMRLCAVGAGFTWPFVKIACDWQVRRAHALVFSDLPSRDIWHMVLGFGVRWWTQGISPVGGMIADPSLLPEPFPLIQTISNNNNSIQSLSLPGTILSLDGQPAEGAIAIVERLDGQRAFVSADKDGNFILQLDSSWAQAEAELTVWGEEGWVRLPQPIEVLIDVPQVITLEPYAQIN